VTVYTFYDFDQSGHAAAVALEEKLQRFAAELDVDITFVPWMLNDDWVTTFRLPTRPHKRNSAADRNWPYHYACELDAVPPDVLRAEVRHCIEHHLPAADVAYLREREREERDLIRAINLGGAR
jgi:hypothetical protein